MVWYGARADVCRLPRFFGWRCTRGEHANGPCAAVPKWWNLRGKYWYWMSGRW